MESNFTPRYEWLDIVESGWPKREYFCELGLILFVIGRWTPLDTLNTGHRRVNNIYLKNILSLIRQSRNIRTPIIYRNINIDMSLTFDNLYCEYYYY